MPSVESLEEKIRERLNQLGPSHFGARKWYKICAALDNLGDTALALKSYRKSGLGRTFPSQYLRLFGVLQSIYIQQDSIKTLWTEIVGSWSNPLSSSGWSRIRRLRNVVGGHPAERGGAVARITIKTQRLLCTSFDNSTNRTVYETIDFKSALRDYTHEAGQILASLYEEVTKPSWREP